MCGDLHCWNWWEKLGPRNFTRVLRFSQSLGTRGSGRTDTLYLSPNMRLSSDAINQSQKSMFCSGRPKNHICSSWFLNRAGNSDHCYSLVGVPTPENLTLWWECKQNTLYLEYKTQDASQHLNPFLNALLLPVLQQVEWQSPPRC